MERPISLRSAIIAATAVVALCLTACGSSATSEADSDTKSITVYSGRAEKLVQPLLDEFTKQTGIQVKARFGDTGELAAQIITERAASKADVFFSQDAGALGAVSDAGQLSKLPAATLDRVPERFRSTKDEWVGTSARARALVYDPAQVSDPPTGIDGLLRPEWAGKIGFGPTNASWQSFVTGLRVLRGDDKARTWLEDFAALDPKPYENNKAILDAVNAGEVAIGLINHYYLFAKIKAEGADKVTAKLQFLGGGDPGGLINTAGIGIVSSTKKTKEAEQFIDFMVSETGQRYFADKVFEYPTVESVPANEAVPPLATLDAPAIDLSDLRSVRETQQMLSDVGLLTK